MSFNISSATIFDSKLWSLAEMPITLFWNNFTAICLGETAAGRGGSQPFSRSVFWHLCCNCLQGCQLVRLYNVDAYPLWQALNHVTQSVETLSGFQLVQCNCSMAQFWTKNKRVSIVSLVFWVMRWNCTEQAYTDVFDYVFTNFLVST